MQKKFDQNRAFTLAEVLITLAIIGVVAALTIPTVVKNYKERQTVSQVKKFYRNVSSLVQQWQVEEGCTSNVADCISRCPQYDCDCVTKEIAKELKVVKSLEGTSENTNLDWLPEYDTLLDGTKQTMSWQGISNQGGNNTICRFLLSDGTTFGLHADSFRKSAFGFFDVNGKKGPNRIGKDVFPFGLGVHNKLKYSGVVPYHNEDNSSTYGLCNLSVDDCGATVDTCTSTSCSPTAYVLKHDKLPPITW